MHSHHLRPCGGITKTKGDIKGNKDIGGNGCKWSLDLTRKEVQVEESSSFFISSFVSRLSRFAGDLGGHPIRKTDEFLAVRSLEKSFVQINA